MERIAGQTPPELADLPELPECAGHVWEWYIDLSSKRTFGTMMANPLTWGEIEAWSRLRGIRPRQWELECLTQLDLVFLEMHAPDSKE